MDHPFECLPEECLRPSFKQFLTVRELGRCRSVRCSWNTPVAFPKLVLSPLTIPLLMIPKLFVVEVVTAVRIFVGLECKDIAYVQQVLSLFPNLKVLLVPNYRGLDLSMHSSLLFVGLSDTIFGPTFPGIREVPSISFPPNVMELQLTKTWFLDNEVLQMSSLQSLQKISGLYEIYNVDDVQLCGELKEALACDVEMDDLVNVPVKNVFAVWCQRERFTNDVVSRLSTLPHLQQLWICQHESSDLSVVCTWPSLKRARLSFVTPALLNVFVLAAHLQCLVFALDSEPDKACWPILPQVQTIVYEPRRRHDFLWFLDHSIFPQLQSVLVDYRYTNDFNGDFCSCTSRIKARPRQLENLYFRRHLLRNVEGMHTLGLYAKNVFISEKWGCGEVDLSGDTIWYLPCSFRAGVSTSTSNVRFLDEDAVAMQFERFDECDAGRVFNHMFEKYKDL